MNKFSNKIIGIIGCGISGIAAAKECIKLGYQIQIFDKESSIGGVWFSKSYPTCKLQTTKYSYCYSDVPHFESTSLYPNRDEILEYLEEVCKKFNLKKYIKFNINIDKTYFNKEKKKWVLLYKSSDNINKTFQCDYLITASGFYTDKKNFEDIVSQKLIGKKVFHASDFSYSGKLKTEIFKNKNVVVIGNGPTGCDLSTIAYNSGAKNVSLLYRSKRWLFRRYLWNKVSTHFILNRLTMNLINISNKHTYIIVVTVLYYIFYIFGHKYFFTIPTPYEPITRNNLVLNDDIVRLIYYNKVKYIKTQKTFITDNFIITSDSNIPYDICVLAIGYNNNIKFMEMNDIPIMYKHIIHPDYPQCGFIGFTATFNWAQVSELQSKWFLNYINNNSVNKKKMLIDINYDLNHKDNKSSDYHDLAINVYNYCDNLAMDMNIKNKYSILNPNYWLLPAEGDLWN